MSLRTRELELMIMRAPLSIENISLIGRKISPRLTLGRTDMAAEYQRGMRYRFTNNGSIYEGTFDGYDANNSGVQYVRWANVLLLTKHTDTPVAKSHHVPKADSHNSVVPG